MDTVLDTDRNLFAAPIRQLKEYALFFLDVNGVIRTWNAGVERLFGYTASEWIGQHASIIFTPADRAMALSEAELGIAREKGSASDIRWHRKKDGAELFAHGVIESVQDNSGRLVGFTKIVSDETERKRLEDSLIQVNVALEHFAYAASHDLQEPLRTVRTFAQLLSKKEGPQLSVEGLDYLDYILGATARMSSLITDLLSYAKAGVEKQPAVFISLDDEVEAAVSQLRASMDEVGAIVTHDPLPRVIVEHTQVTRLFLNLISNAIKYRAPDRKPHIHISPVGVDDRFATIAVRDNGVGFPRIRRGHLRTLQTLTGGRTLWIGRRPDDLPPHRGALGRAYLGRVATGGRIYFLFYSTNQLGIVARRQGVEELSAFDSVTTTKSLFVGKRHLPKAKNTLEDTSGSQ